MNTRSENQLASASKTITVTQAPRLLHLGCGLIAPPEWINVDGSMNAWFAKFPRLRRLCATFRLVPRIQTEIPWPKNITIANLRKPLPFSSNAFDAAFSSHVLEHLHRSDALLLLQECFRTLRPGGLCRAVVPDFRAIVDEYLGLRNIPGEMDAHDDPARKCCQRLLMRTEDAPSGGWIYRFYSGLTEFHSHKWMYDGPSLVKLMQEAGFESCVERSFLQSQIAHLDKVELPGRVLDGAGVVVEGVKAICV